MSSELNPDFRSCDEVEVSELTGWTDGTVTEEEALNIEHNAFEELEENNPQAFQTRPARDPLPEMLEKWNEFQKSKGRYEGSADWSLLDEFAFKKPLLWKPQIIGSCVVSNTFRAYVIRQMYEIILLGVAEEYLGRDEYGPKNFSFYCPVTYGMARERANMRGGDGLYCEPMTASLMYDGVLSCNTPKLIEFLNLKGLGDSTDYPEPQGNSGAKLYRDFGNWKNLSYFKPYLDNPVLESPTVTNGDQLWDLLQAGKPAYVCSMEAIHKIGTHPDGFPIHARNPRDRWAHNMAFHGAFIASDGERFIRQSNESWGGHHIYNRRLEEVDNALRSGNLACQAIGEINGPPSSPPTVA